MKQNRRSWSLRHSPACVLWYFFVENWHTKNQGHKKKVPILKVGGSAPGPSHTQQRIRVVLLHTKGIVQSYFSSIVIKCWHSFYNQKNANAKWMFPLVAVSSGMLNTSMPKKQVVSGQCLGKDNGCTYGFSSFHTPAIAAAAAVVFRKILHSVFIKRMCT